MDIYTHIDDTESRDKHRICDLALLPLHVTPAVTQEKHLRWLGVIVISEHAISPNLEATNGAGGWNSKQL